MKRFGNQAGAFCLLLTLLLMSPSACPDARAAEPETPLSLAINEGQLFPLGAAASEILLTDPAIADIRLTATNGLFIYGKQPGRTHVMALGPRGERLFERVVTVLRDVALIEEMLNRQFPESRLGVSATPGRIILSGQAHSPLQAEQIIAVTRGFLGEGEEIVNRMELTAPSQVNIRVRIVEMNREASKNLGINWDMLLNPGSLAIGLITNRWPSVLGGGGLLPSSASTGLGGSALFGYQGSNGSASLIIDALAEENLLTVLAEPNLTSRSGETASFFAGGEFPIPVSATDEQITIEFKKFGVILDITPTVLSNDRISIHIRPEVSEISDLGAVVINNFRIPGIAVRRTEATIELASGQSFAVAGLLQNQTRNVVREVPWLAALAILGPLFRSSRYRNMETELVIIATANIVTPRNRDDYRTAVDRYQPTDTFEKMTTGRLARPVHNAEIPEEKDASDLKLKGPAGFIY